MPKAATKAKAEPEAIAAPLIAYKSFNADWTCRGFQYAVGQTYVHDGDILLCSVGFHACEYSLDIFGYYPPTGQMAEVELSEVSGRTDSDSKRVAKSITIKAALTIPLLVSAAIEWTLKRCEPAKAAHPTGDQSASSATGDQAIAAAFGLASKAMAGDTGIVVVAWWDEKADRKRPTTGYVGENGIKPDTWYRAAKAGELVEVE